MTFRDYYKRFSRLLKDSKFVLGLMPVAELELRALKFMAGHYKTYLSDVEHIQGMVLLDHF